MTVLETEDPSDFGYTYFSRTEVEPGEAVLFTTYSEGTRLTNENKDFTRLEIKNWGSPLYLTVSMQAYKKARMTERTLQIDRGHLEKLIEELIKLKDNLAYKKDFKPNFK